MKKFIGKTEKFHCGVAKAYSKTNTATIIGSAINLL